MPDWSFCVANVLRDGNESDLRAGGGDDPFHEKEELRMPYPSILKGMYKGLVLLDVEGLAARAMSQKRVDKAGVEKLLKALREPTTVYPSMDCYDPHHAFVFYDTQGIPRASIEVCLTCNSVETLPELSHSTRANMLKIAQLISGVGLPLTPVKSMESYTKRCERLLAPKAK